MIKHLLILISLLIAGRTFSQQWQKAVMVPQIFSGATSVIDTAGNIFLFTGIYSTFTCHKLSAALNYESAKYLPPGFEITNVQMNSKAQMIISANLSKAIKLGNTEYSHPKYYNAFLGAFDPDMNVIWGKNFRGNGTSRAMGMCISNSDHIYLCGGISDTFSLDGIQFKTPGNANSYVAKFSPKGQLQWIKCDSMDLASSTSNFSHIFINRDNEILISGAKSAEGKTIFNGCDFSTPASNYNTTGYYNIITGDTTGSCISGSTDLKQEYTTGWYGGLTSSNYFNITQVSFNGNSASLAILDKQGIPLAMGIPPIPEVTDFVEFLGVIENEAYFLYKDNAYQRSREAENYICRIVDHKVVPVAVFNGEVWSCTLHKSGSSAYFLSGIFRDYARFGNDSILTTKTGGSPTYHPFVAKFNGALATGFSEYPEIGKLQLFPNPTSGEVTVRLHTTPGIASIRIYDVTGRLAQREERAVFSDETVDLDLRDRSPGIYFIEMKTGAIILRGKIVRE